MAYQRIETPEGWIICEAGRDFNNPARTSTFAFDTETFIYIDGIKVSAEELTEKAIEMKTAEKRKRISSEVWCWQCYDELNGFFATSSFDIWLQYQAHAGYEYGWCYNAKFDFSQIDYKILTDPKWRRHIKKQGAAYNKGQEWAFDSIHNDQGARYAYKLWIKYKHVNRHTHVHAVEYRDFMNIFPGGLAKMLDSLNVCDDEGVPIRKLKMEYQAVDPNHLTNDEIMYIMIDVKGLYYGIKQYNNVIEQQSCGERHIFGSATNVMTAGGFAKAELLRSLYPDISPSKRLKHYQKDHPLTATQDKWLRDNHLYRGGISLVNPRYAGKLVTSDMTGKPMRRYDVNSEYPFAMSIIRDLVGKPTIMDYDEWTKKAESYRNDYECIMILNSVHGYLRDGYIPVWYDPFRRDYTARIWEDKTHLMYEREFNEYLQWYDIEYECDKVLLYKRGEYAYKPFVEENYTLKAQAKKDKNPALSAVVKLKLNSSYGKLAERVLRKVGEYQYNEETGAIHFVRTGEELDETCIMNVAIGALVTAVARVWILSHIREICHEELMTYEFVYIDTDSIHAFVEYDKADPYTLGAFKEEAICPTVKYICPKTYIDIETSGNELQYDIIDDKIKLKGIEVHAKGINIISIHRDFINQIMKENRLSIEYVNKRFSAGQQFDVLCAMNVKGGKALIPTLKYLAVDEQDTANPLVNNQGYCGQYLSEI